MTLDPDFMPLKTLAAALRIPVVHARLWIREPGVSVKKRSLVSALMMPVLSVTQEEAARPLLLWSKKTEIGPRLRSLSEGWFYDSEAVRLSVDRCYRWRTSLGRWSYELIWYCDS